MTMSTALHVSIGRHPARPRGLHPVDGDQSACVKQVVCRNWPKMVGPRACGLPKCVSRMAHLRGHGSSGGVPSDTIPTDVAPESVVPTAHGSGVCPRMCAYRHHSGSGSRRMGQNDAYVLALGVGHRAQGCLGWADACLYGGHRCGSCATILSHVMARQRVGVCTCASWLTHVVWITPCWWRICRHPPGASAAHSTWAHRPATQSSSRNGGEPDVALEVRADAGLAQLGSGVREGARGTTPKNILCALFGGGFTNNGR